MAMERIPPDFLRKAMSLPPKKVEAAAIGHLLSIKLLTKALKDEMRG
jgi:hypothetical protein